MFQGCEWAVSCQEPTKTELFNHLVRAGEQSRRDIVGRRSSALQRAVSPNPSQKHRHSAPDINVRVRHAHREVARENDRVWITPRDLVQLVVSQRTHFQVLCHRRAPRLLGGKQSHERLHARFGGSKGRQSVICVIDLCAGSRSDRASARFFCGPLGANAAKCQMHVRPLAPRPTGVLLLQHLRTSPIG